MTDARLEHETENFRFESPGAGAYRVKLLGDDVANNASMLLAGDGDISSLSLSPGIYTAIIEPIGSGETIRQPVELQSGASDPIKLLDAIFDGTYSLPAGVETFKLDLAEAFAAPNENVVVELSSEPIVQTSSRPIRYGAKARDTIESGDTPARRGFSLALSVRHARDPGGMWRPSQLSTTVSDQPSGGIAIVLRKPSDWRTRPIWRLTAAVKDDPRWRMRIPLFNGGLQVVLTPTSTPSGPDLAVTVAPRNSGRAALVSNLESMFLGSATEVIRATLPAFRDGGSEDLIASLMDADEDPWTITVAALLLARTEELAPMSSSLRVFAKKWSWLPDIAVLQAWVTARDRQINREKRDETCLALLRDIPGRPYFAATQTLGQDLLTGLALGGGSAIRPPAASQLDRWCRLGSRQIPTGPLLAAEDGRLAKGVSLSRRNYETFATGVVQTSQIEITPTETPRRKGDKMIPALTREQTRSNDPWKGRFGGKARRDGFELQARFARGLGQWVELEIIVRGSAKDREVVEIFLHDSFHPDRLKLKFSGGAASYATLAWGGFTVGAWLPTRGIELELDLAEMPDAPTAIRDF